MFNRHNMRSNYSCTSNLERIIKPHNHKVLNINTKNESQCKCACSCKYPLKGDNCRTENIVYMATVNSDLETSFTLVSARLSLDSDAQIIKNILKAACMKMILNFRSIFAA